MPITQAKISRGFQGLLNAVQRKTTSSRFKIRAPGPQPFSLTVLRRVRKEEIRGLTVLLISFKQYDRGSRPNFGEGGPLASEGAGGAEKGASGEEEGWRGVGVVGWQGAGQSRANTRYRPGRKRRHDSRRLGGEGKGGKGGKGDKTQNRHTDDKGKRETPSNTISHITEWGRQHWNNFSRTKEAEQDPNQTLNPRPYNKSPSAQH